MRILYLPLLAKGGANEQYDLLEAFRNRHDVEVVDYLNVADPNGKLIAAYDAFQPDVVHGQFQETNKIASGVLRNLKARKPSVIFTQWTGDVRTYIVPHVVDIGRQVDFTLFSNHGDLLRYREATGRPTAYWQNAVGGRFFPEPAPRDGSVVFCGNQYGHFPASHERCVLVDALRAKFGGQFKHFGSGWGPPVTPLVWERQPDVYRTASVTVGHNHIPDIDGFFSDRQLIAMASGAPHVCRNGPGLKKIFEDGVHCLFWDTVEQAVEHVAWCLNHPGEASTIGEAGRKEVLRAHTWDVRVREYEELLQTLPLDRGDPHA